MGWKAWEHPVPLLLQSCSRSAPPLSATSVTQPDGDGKPEMGIFQTSAGTIFAQLLFPAIQTRDILFLSVEDVFWLINNKPENLFAHPPPSPLYQLCNIKSFKKILHQSSDQYMAPEPGVPNVLRIFTVLHYVPSQLTPI